MENIRVTREEVKRFLSIIIGYCDTLDDCIVIGDWGNGNGDGLIKCDGYGDGYGVGSGDSEGYGFSSNSFSVDSDFGYGCGFGSAGYGRRDGSGDDSAGCEYGGIKALNGNIVDYIDYVPSIITQVHGNIACGYIVKEDLTLESCFIAKAGNSFAHGKTLKDAVADAEAKETERLPVEKRIEKFIEVFGSLDSEHTGKEFYDWHHILTGSCKMGRDEFCRSHSIDLAQKYSVRYFLDITKDSYGSDVIKMIIKAYENIEE